MSTRWCSRCWRSFPGLAALFAHLDPDGKCKPADATIALSVWRKTPTAQEGVAK